MNQKVAPASFTFDGAAWLVLGYFDFSEPTVTVTMTNAGTDGVILADGVLINRIGGGIPPGNSVGQAAGLPGTDSGGSAADPASLRSEPAARDAALLAAAY